jgi:transcriptional regulator with XRE-family HTH domain
MSTKNSKESLAYLENIAGKLTFASLLLSIRKGEEMSQVDFAKMLKVSRQYLCDLEHGRRVASPKAAAGYAVTLGYSVHQFVRLCLQDLINKEGLKLKIDVQDAA